MKSFVQIEPNKECLKYYQNDDYSWTNPPVEDIDEKIFYNNFVSDFYIVMSAGLEGASYGDVIMDDWSVKKSGDLYSVVTPSGVVDTLALIPLYVWSGFPIVPIQDGAASFISAGGAFGVVNYIENTYWFFNTRYNILAHIKFDNAIYDIVNYVRLFNEEL